MYNFDTIIGCHPQIVKILRLVAQVADADATVLIYGESGTGKELIAEALHYNSRRREKPFVPLNCGAFAENLLESELFGHVRGAFTGAVEDKQGWFGRADGGTIFFDEIQEMSQTLQIKLLRILQSGQYHKVGSTEFQNCNVRIVAATNKDLQELITKGGFREELFYRLNVIDLNLPPLKDRRSDIPKLVDFFLTMFCKQYEKGKIDLTDSVRDQLYAYDFPGNIRELRNLIERLVILDDCGIIDCTHLPEKVLCKQPSKQASDRLAPFKEAKQSAIEEFERHYFVNCLKAAKGNMTRAASNAGIHVTHLYSKVKQYEIDPLLFKKNHL